MNNYELRKELKIKRNVGTNPCGCPQDRIQITLNEAKRLGVKSASYRA